MLHVGSDDALRALLRDASRAAGSGFGFRSYDPDEHARALGDPTFPDRYRGMPALVRAWKDLVAPTVAVALPRCWSWDARSEPRSRRPRAPCWAAWSRAWTLRRAWRPCFGPGTRAAVTTRTRSTAPRADR